MNFAVTAGPVALPTNCADAPGCRWWSFQETGIPVGTYTLRCFDTTNGDYGLTFSIDITSGSWSFVSNGLSGYCANATSGVTVYATLSAAGLGTYQSANYVWP